MYPKEDNDMIAIIIIVLLISSVIGVVIGKRIRAYRLLKKMLGEQIKNNIRPENTFTFDQLIEKYGGGGDE